MAYHPRTGLHYS